MKLFYNKPTVRIVRMEVGLYLLAGSDQAALSVTMSGYDAAGSDNENDGFSQDE